MKIIAGLGNPGKQYEKTWHNLGFSVMDAIALQLQLPKFKLEKKLLAEITSGKFGKEKIILAKPQTFMNNSGEAIQALLKFFKGGSDDLIIIHDDLDLPLGKIRVAQDSSSGGHNGVKSIISMIKTQNFARIKMGIASPKLSLMDPADLVLQKIGRDQAPIASQATKKAAEAALCILETSLREAMNLYN